MAKNDLSLEHYGYDLPEPLIAQKPLADRGHARLMIVDRSAGTIRHDIFDHIGKYLPPRCLIVRNNSKVIPARLLGNKKRTGGKVEIFLLKRLWDGASYEVLMRPTRKIHDGDDVLFDGSSLTARVIDKENGIVRFNRKNILKYLQRIGHMPLPPYIRRPDTASDREFYQTVYARHAGSVASPTAGLHFTKELIRELTAGGHRWVDVTLHVNYATFKPVEEPDITRHRMHTEEYSMSRNHWAAVRQAREQGRRIVAVGTTSCRVLETAAATEKLKGRTDLFIYPGYRFNCVDILITNFHLPFSTLLILVYAFGGRPLMQEAYREAIKEKYRFYSYGDGMIIL